MNLNPKMAAVLDRFDKALSEIEGRVSAFVSTPLTQNVDKQNSIQSAKVKLAHIYSINSLYYMLLKVNGISPKLHPVKTELDRVKRYMEKTMANDTNSANCSEKVTLAEQARTKSQDSESAEKLTGSRKRKRESSVQDCLDKSTRKSPKTHPEGNFSVNIPSELSHGTKKKKKRTKRKRR